MEHVKWLMFGLGGWEVDKGNFPRRLDVDSSRLKGDRWNSAFQNAAKGSLANLFLVGLELYIMRGIKQIQVMGVYGGGPSIHG